MPKIAQGMIDLLVNAAFDSGYYQAVLEKQSATLSDSELKEYARLNQDAITRREQARDFIKGRLV